MKKILVLTLFFMLGNNLKINAAEKDYGEFANILNDRISDYGAFNGSGGVISASFEPFYYDTDMLFICSADNSVVSCAVYAVNDGAGCVDTLTLDLSGQNALLSLITYDEMSYLLLERNGENEYFALLDDSFTHVPPIVYSTKRDLLSADNGKINTLSNTAQELYNFLNSMRLETISSYPYMNKANVISGEMRDNITRFLTACAGLTEFDRGNYDYDRVFKYVLYTHSSFTGIVPVPPHNAEESDIKSVSAEFIDYIMLNILGIEPEHPEVTALTERGFCYRDGMYMYTGGFSADFSTEILELVAVHELGGGIYHVVFSDIYSENGTDIPEYSYAVISLNNGGFSLIRLGMGKNLLTSHQINRYAPISGILAPAWETTSEPTPASEENTERNGILLAAAIAAALAGGFVFIAALRRFARGGKSG